MKRRIGIGLLVAGACSACWVAPVLVAAVGAGWLGALGASWPWMLATATAAGLALVAARRLARRPPDACGHPPA